MGKSCLHSWEGYIGLHAKKDDSPLFKKMLEISIQLMGPKHIARAAMDNLLNWLAMDQFQVTAAYDFFKLNDCGGLEALHYS